MEINLCWSCCYYQRLWSDLSFCQVLEKSLCVLRHSKQQPVWEKKATQKQTNLENQNFQVGALDSAETIIFGKGGSTKTNKFRESKLLYGAPS